MASRWFTCYYKYKTEIHGLLQLFGHLYVIVYTLEIYIFSYYFTHGKLVRQELNNVHTCV